MSVELALRTFPALATHVLPGTPDARELHAGGFELAAVRVRFIGPLEGSS